MPSIPSMHFEQIFLQSATEVLQAMFFMDVVPETDSSAASAAAFPDDEAPLSAELSFDGSRSGVFGVRVPMQTARVIAANFLGIEEASDSHAAEVLGELANILCGSVLSRIEEKGRFELSHPVVHTGIKEESREAQGKDAVEYTFGTEEGPLILWMRTGLDTPRSRTLAWSATETR